MKVASVVVLTGAGISQESGLDTFRCAGGVWSQVDLEDVCTPEGYGRDPERVHAFYNDRRAQLRSALIHPNAAHFALSRLERDYPGDVLVVTQNIDDLHERAGSRSLIHMHGELRKVRCDACRKILPWDDPCSVAATCPVCGVTGRLRPHVVWFGEMPLEMERIYAALEKCGVFLSIGTSGNVYPAAGFVRAASSAGAETVELNLEPSQGAAAFDRSLHGPATRTVPACVADLLQAAKKQYPV